MIMKNYFDLIRAATKKNLTLIDVGDLLGCSDEVDCNATLAFYDVIVKVTIIRFQIKHDLMVLGEKLYNFRKRL